MTSLFAEGIDTEDREPSVPITGDLYGKKYFYKYARLVSNASNASEKLSQIIAQKHLLEGKATENYLLCRINHNFLNDFNL